MINGELRNHVDKLWTGFWTGGITNPLMVIEQISFLMFARLLDIRETREEKKVRRTNKPFRRIFSDKDQECRWSHFKNLTPAEEMLKFMSGKVFLLNNK
ncbi:MAG: type I restriction-modification system subunit M N-terminal domain-containing protein [Proteobacteria bacterium]|nr:type I restriction-modification system subunit M N-terminal domain-containing protein [Pseudomonadota bacterium]